MDDPRRCRHDPLDIPIMRIEQGAAGDEATHIWLAHRALPAVDDLRQLITRITAEEQDRHRRRGGDLRDPGGGGDLEPGEGTARAQARGDRHRTDELLIASVEIGAALRILEVGEWLDHAGNPLVGQLRHDLTAHLDGARHPGVGELDAQQQLATVESRGGNVLRVVRRDPVVQLPQCTLESTAVDRADGHATLKCTQPRQLLQDVGTGHDAINPRHRQSAQEVIEQGVSISHGQGIGPDSEHSARSVISRQHH